MIVIISNAWIREKKSNDDILKILNLNYATIDYIKTTRIHIVVNRSAFKTQSNIYHGDFRKNSERLKAVNYFCRKLYLRCSAEF